MNVKFMNPFVKAAFDVLSAELGLTPKRGQVSLESATHTTDEVTVLLTLVGGVQGAVLYGMSEATALGIVSTILGQPFAAFDSLAQSGISELGNVITGHASKNLAEAGFVCDISPPTLMTGKGVHISTVDFKRLLVPVLTDLGEIQIHIALREGHVGVAELPEARVKAGA